MRRYLFEPISHTGDEYGLTFTEFMNTYLNWGAKECNGKLISIYEYDSEIGYFCSEDEAANNAEEENCNCENEDEDCYDETTHDVHVTWELENSNVDPTLENFSKYLESMLQGGTK
jgi:hypothetical protein